MAELIDYQGLPALELKTSEGARAVVSPHGAQVLSWLPAMGGERLYLSERAEFAPGKAIRGGIPVLFPQFGLRGPGPKHGFVRQRTWTMLNQRQEKNSATATLRIESDAETRALWPHDFAADLSVMIERNRLDVELEIFNTSSQAFSFTAGLHTYFSTGNVEMGRLVGLEGPLSIGLLAAAMIAGGWYVVPRGLRALRRLSPLMHALMSIAALGAALIGEWGEGASALFLFAVALLLEEWAVGRARRSIAALLDLAPSEALVIRLGGERTVPVAEGRPGERIRIRPGERVALDGTIVSGTSALNEAPITGEAAPVDKEPGDPVYAGTVNGPGAREARTPRAASRLLEEHGERLEVRGLDAVIVRAQDEWAGHQKVKWPIAGGDRPRTGRGDRIRT